MPYCTRDLRNFDFKAGEDNDVCSAVCVGIRIMTDDEAADNVERQVPQAEFQIEIPLAQISQVVDRFQSIGGPNVGSPRTKNSPRMDTRPS